MHRPLFSHLFDQLDQRLRDEDRYYSGSNQSEDDGLFEAMYQTETARSTMQHVSVKRGDLLEKVKANRDAHRDLFLKAQEGFKARVIEELDQMLADARHGRSIRTFVNLVEPQDHTRDYDRVILMLEMSTEEVVTIDGNNFAQFVMDDWAWKAQATTINTAYSTGSKMSRS